MPSVLITGGTGTLGNALVKSYLENDKYERIIIYSRCEFKQSEMQKLYHSEKLRYFIGDVRDKERLMMAMRGVDIVIHAAALKQVPAIEYNPIEAVKTNITGTINIIETAIYNGVDKVVFISTDKAVEPINLYGATKMSAEKLIINANHYSPTKTKFSAVRYGNVTGSRGSIVPLFREIKNNTYPITNKNMTRFWMTTESAVKLIDDAIEGMQGGEIFIPKMMAYYVIDLVQAINNNATMIITGIRPGEKLHETILSEDDMRRVKIIGDNYVVHKNHVSDGTINSYNSYNTQKMSVDMIRNELEKI